MQNKIVTLYCAFQTNCSMWNTEEDFERDWWAMADGAAGGSSDASATPIPPISGQLKEARAKVKPKRSIYDPDTDDEDDFENVERCVPSRGRSLERAWKPVGGVLTEKDLRRITQQQIREVGFNQYHILSA